MTRWTIGGALASDTSVKWAAVPGAVKYRVHWRRADARDWTDHLDVTATEASLKGVIVDDNFVGVSAIGADGAESLVTFGRRGGRPLRSTVTGARAPVQTRQASAVRIRAGAADDQRAAADAALHPGLRLYRNRRLATTRRDAART